MNPTLKGDIKSWIAHFVIVFWVTLVGALFFRPDTAAGIAAGVYLGREIAQHEEHGTPPGRRVDRVMDAVSALLGALLALWLLT